MLCGAYMRRGSLVCFVMHTCDRGAQYDLWCIHATGELSMLCDAYMQQAAQYALWCMHATGEL